MNIESVERSGQKNCKNQLRTLLTISMSGQEIEVTKSSANTNLSEECLNVESSSASHSTSVADRLSRYSFQDHDFFDGPKLILIVSGLQRFGRFNLAYVIVAVLWLIWLFQFAYGFEEVVAKDDFYFIYQRIGNLIWGLHNTIIYTIVAQAIFGRGASSDDHQHWYFSAMEYLLHAGVTKQRQCDSSVCVTRQEAILERECEQLTTLSRALSVLTIGLVLTNTAIVGNQFISNSEWDTYFPIPHSVAVTVTATVVWYFFAYGWSLSIVFVCLPSFVFTLRAQEYAKYIEEQEASFDVEQAMSWYDDLYRSNKVLNDIASPLVTTNVALCFPLTVFLILSHSHGEVSGTSNVAWIAINALIMLLSTGSVAYLYAVNGRVSMALGEKSSLLQFRGDQIAGYQLALLKISAIPLGVRFFGTRQFITPSIIFRVLALVSSFFVFLSANKFEET